MTQEAQILQLLRDGTWWTCAELLREVPCVVHSRIAGLRAKGHTIIHRRVGPGAHGSAYCLVELNDGRERPETAAVLASPPQAAVDTRPSLSSSALTERGLCKRGGSGYLTPSRDLSGAPRSVSAPLSREEPRRPLAARVGEPPRPSDAGPLTPASSSLLSGASAPDQPGTCTPRPPATRVESARSYETNSRAGQLNLLEGAAA